MCVGVNVCDDGSFFWRKWVFFFLCFNEIFFGFLRMMEWNVCGVFVEKSVLEERRDWILLNFMIVSGFRGWFNVLDKWLWFLGFGLGFCLENCGFCLLKRKFFDV